MDLPTQGPNRGSSQSRTSKALRVLMIVENCPYARDPRVRREATTLVKAGHQVSVISPAWTRQAWRQLIDGVKVYQFPLVSVGGAQVGYVFEYLVALLAITVLTAAIFFGDGFDVIHVANPPDWIILVVAFYKLFGKLIIFDQHDLCPELYHARFHRPSATVSSVLTYLERFSYTVADYVIVTNESYKDVALHRGGRSPERVAVVRNGPDLDDIRVIEADPELRSKSANIILYAGIIGAQDGVDFLCRALQNLRYKLGREDFYCVVLGEGDALAEVKALAHSLGLDGFIYFAGWVNDSATYARYLATADICAAPEPSNSYNDRSTFVKVMEYMCSGKPIVAFDLPETRFSAGRAALYARPNDEADFAQQLARLMDDPALRRSSGEIGQQRIRRKLAWEYSAPVLLSVYENLANPMPAFRDVTSTVATTTTTTLDHTPPTPDKVNATGNAGR